MDTYRLYIALKGNLQDKQFWASAKRSQQVLAPNGLQAGLADYIQRLYRPP